MGSRLRSDRLASAEHGAAQGLDRTGRRREDERQARGGARWELPITAWHRYERGQTVWDIGLDPQPFDVTLAEAVGKVKPELSNGVVFGSTDVRDQVLSALLANVGLRQVIRLAPLELWLAAVGQHMQQA